MGDLFARRTSGRRQRWRTWCGLCAAGSLSILSAQRPPSDFVRADAAIVRLEPALFSELPSAIRTDLEKRGCTVPQPAVDGKRNVVRGRFLTGRRIDWAVLCSRDRHSAILVFDGTSADWIAELGSEPDMNYLQVVDRAGAIGYSRVVAVAAPNAVRQRVRSDGPIAPDRIDHDGIEDAFVGKSSLIWYWSGQRWLRLAAAD